MGTTRPSTLIVLNWQTWSLVAVIVFLTVMTLLVFH
jgi:hypothetical protein